MSVKKTVCIICVALLFLFVSYHSDAQVNSPAFNASPSAVSTPNQIMPTGILPGGSVVIQPARPQFLQKLNIIKNQVKKIIVARINDRIPIINARETARMTATLNTLTQIIGRISDRIIALKQQGKNTDSAQTALANAQAAITAAQVAVSAQGAKQYTVSIITEKSLRATVGASVSKFRQDLIITQQRVNAAKGAVLKVYNTILLTAGDTNQISTSSAKKLPIMQSTQSAQ